MAPHSSTVAQKIPWMEEPGRLQSMGSLTVRHDWVTSLSLSTFMHWRRKWQPTPVFLPGESQGQRSLVGCSPWGPTESDTTEATWQRQQQPLYWLPRWLSGEELPASAGDEGDVDLISGLGISPGGGNDNPFQYFSLENHMDRGAWRAHYSPWGPKELDTTEQLSMHAHTLLLLFSYLWQKIYNRYLYIIWGYLLIAHAHSTYLQSSSQYENNLQGGKDMCIKIISTLILKLIVPFYNYCPSCQNPLNWSMMSLFYMLKQLSYIISSQMPCFFQHQQV